jgi:hypothetical protein
MGRDIEIELSERGAQIIDTSGADVPYGSCSVVLADGRSFDREGSTPEDARQAAMAAALSALASHY